MSFLVRSIAAWSGLLLAAVPAHSAIACDPVAAHMVGIMSLYQGTIGPYPVRMGLQFGTRGDVTGLYGYAAGPGRLALAGRLTPDGRLLLTESVAGGRGSARFVARMPGQGDAACQTISGTWIAAGTGRRLAVRLRYSDTSFRPLAYYLRPGDLRVERAAVAFRAAALAGHRRAVVAALRDPVRVSLGGRGSRLARPAAVLAHYAAIFTPDAAIFTPVFLARLRADVPHLLFVRDQGFMLGGGAVWFDRAGKVITLNN